MNDYPCHGTNYKKGRNGGIKYLVIHYVGATGSAAANARYYGDTPNIGASAHYFVGHAVEDAAIWRSVLEEDTAWHVGAKQYIHPECRNGNSIGVELCCHKRADGSWYFDPETLDAAVELCRDIVTRYSLDKSHVLRHYDVTQKKCPAPFVDNVDAWVDFKERLFAQEEEKEDSMKIYRYVAEMPAWAQEAATKAIQRGIIKLDSTGACTVWEPNLQPLVWMDRLGLLDKPAVEGR